MLQKLRDFCAREEIPGRLIATILSLIVLAYTLVAAFGRALPPANQPTPELLRLFAMMAAALGLLRVMERFQKGQSPIPPLLWIFFASLMHLASVGMQRGWLSGGRS
jgi:hypothetical protein